MAKVKVRREGNLLWEEECQPLTNEQMADIKSQFHPSNTANVNMVSYDIYDYDGDEHVVGEWRQTVNGVKKKKPVYEKVINNTAKGTSSSMENVGTFSDLVSDSAERLIKTSVLVYTTTTDFTDACISNVYLKGDVNVGQRFSSESKTYRYILTLHYTKTTDSWETVV